MMQKIVKMSLIFVGGFATGVIASCLAAKHFLDIQWIESDEDNEPVKESESSTKESTEKSIETKDSLSEKYDGVEDNPEYVNYNKLCVDYNLNSESEDIYDNVIPDDVDIFGDPKDPYVIDEDKFGEVFEYDETYIKYFEKEELLTDDWNCPITDEIKVIGNEAKNKLLEGDSDVVYVKNDKLKAYYRIAVQHEDYPGISG